MFKPFQSREWRHYQPDVIFGYWAEKKEYATAKEPWPVPDPSWNNGVEQAALLEALSFAEAYCQVDAYRGSSPSRLTGENVGSREFSFYDPMSGIRYRWPEGYRHYIENGVRPPDEFFLLMNFIRVVYAELPPPPKYMA